MTGACVAAAAAAAAATGHIVGVIDFAKAELWGGMGASVAEPVLSPRRAYAVGGCAAQHCWFPQIARVVGAGDGVHR
eukprot:COSAG02_NODE_25112_length_668_cov_17.606327_2_plen_76_part_01